MKNPKKTKNAARTENAEAFPRVYSRTVVHQNLKIDGMS